MVERVAYVLGAGASFDAGGPLISDFFSRERSNDAKIYARWFDDNERYLTLEGLYQDWASGVKEPNVEKFFQHVSLRRITGDKFIDSRSGSKVNPETVERYLTWYISSYVKHSIAAQRTPKFYRDFALSLKKRGKRFSVITFNYDMVLEKSVIKELGSINYGFGIIRGLWEFSNPLGIPLVKLHGSLNWLRCPECDRLEIFDKPVAHVFRRERCGGRCKGYKEPVIVPPVQNKEEYLGPKNQLWRKARGLLLNADRVIIVGYSLPDLDIAAQELLRSSLTADTDVEIINRSLPTAQSVAKKLGLVDRSLPLRYTPTPTTFKEYVHVITD